MSFGIQTWDAQGRLTFDGNAKTIRQMEKVHIPSGASGGIALSLLPNGIKGVLFDPVYGWSDAGIVPHTFVSGGALHWRGGVGAFYLTVLGAAV